MDELLEVEDHDFIENIELPVQLLDPNVQLLCQAEWPFLVK
jgi:hypothetical protein